MPSNNVPDAWGTVSALEESRGGPLGGAARSAFAITLSADFTCPQTTRAIYCGGTGNLKVDLVDVGTGITLTGLVAGAVYPLRVTKVYSTANGTTASALVGLY